MDSQPQEEMLEVLTALLTAKTASGNAPWWHWNGDHWVCGYCLRPGSHADDNPIDEALSFLHSASKHMGTAIDDVATAVERLQCLPDVGAHGRAPKLEAIQ